MKIIKRSGMEVEFDRSKIIAAVKRANNSVVEAEKVSDEQVEKIAEDTERDNFMSAEEAKAYGLIDEIVESRNAAKEKE